MTYLNHLDQSLSVLSRQDLILLLSDSFLVFIWLDGTAEKISVKMEQL